MIFQGVSFLTNVLPFEIFLNIVQNISEQYIKMKDLLWEK